MKRKKIYIYIYLIPNNKEYFEANKKKHITINIIHPLLKKEEESNKIKAIDYIKHIYKFIFSSLIIYIYFLL